MQQGFQKRYHVTSLVLSHVVYPYIQSSPPLSSSLRHIFSSSQLQLQSRVSILVLVTSCPATLVSDAGRGILSSLFSRSACNSLFVSQSISRLHQYRRFRLLLNRQLHLLGHRKDPENGGPNARTPRNFASHSLPQNRYYNRSDRTDDSMGARTTTS